MDIAPIILAYLLPVGVVLIAWGSWDSDRARDHATTVLWVMSLAAIVYAAFGFAFQFGGIGLRADVPPGLSGLDRMWSPLSGPDSRYWTLIGLKGFALNAPSILPGDTTLLFTQFLSNGPFAPASVAFAASAAVLKGSPSHPNRVSPTAGSTSLTRIPRPVTPVSTKSQAP